MGASDPQHIPSKPYRKIARDPHPPARATSNPRAFSTSRFETGLGSWISDDPGLSHGGPRVEGGPFSLALRGAGLPQGAGARARDDFEKGLLVGVLGTVGDGPAEPSSQSSCCCGCGGLRHPHGAGDVVADGAAGVFGGPGAGAFVRGCGGGLSSLQLRDAQEGVLWRARGHPVRRVPRAGGEGAGAAVAGLWPLW